MNLPSLPGTIKRFFYWMISLDFRQFAKYYAFGLLINACGYAIFVLLLQMGVKYIAAAGTTYVAGVLASFWLNRTFVFKGDNTLYSRLARLLLMLGAGYCLNILILYLGVDICMLRPELVQLFSMLLVSVSFYFLNKFYIHNGRR